MLNIYFLGKSRIEYDGKRLDQHLGNKTIALICLLALNEKRYLSREKIIGYLWPDSNEDAAKYNLRYNLWCIKKNIGTDKSGNLFLKVDNECCGINKDYVFKCDVLDIMKFKPRKDDSIDDILKLKQLFKGDLLEGCYFNKCDEFNELIISKRIYFERRKVIILKRLIELYEKDNNYDACIEVINEVLEIEPYDEGMVSEILDIYVKCGNPVAAITYYNNFSSRLVGSLGILPSDELKNKYEEIRLSLMEGSSYIENETDNINKDNDLIKSSSEIKISTDCIKNIDYFWISNVLGKLVSVVAPDYMKRLNKKELYDLGYIQSELLRYCDEQFEIGYKSEVMGVCIINAFVKLLKYICNDMDLTIFIVNSHEMDEISSSVLKYIKSLHIEGLKFVE